MAGSLPGTNAPAGVVAAVWLGLAGCGADPAGPTVPPEPPALSTAPASAPAKPAGSVTAAVPREAVAELDFTDEIADLRARMLPSLQPAAREALAGALGELAARTAAGDPAGAAATLARAAGALRDDDASPADLDALRRTLTSMRAAVFPSSLEHPTRSGGTDDQRAR